jgi:hypothetical protein
MDDKKELLTQEEADFCLMYVNAPAPYTYNATKCYEYVFGSEENDPMAQARLTGDARHLLEKECVMRRIEELQKINQQDSTALKGHLNSTLVHIMDECSTRECKDRLGTSLSPAALRSVAVSAAKMLMDMNGIKEETDMKIQLGGSAGNGITFNLIAPQENKNKDVTDDK